MKKRKRNIILTIVVLVVVGLGIWAYSRWDVWFGNPPEAPYTASKTPSRVLLTFGNEGELSRMVSWMCGDKVDENDKKKAEKEIEELKNALKGDNIDDIKEKKDKLNETAMALGAKVYEEMAKKAQAEQGSSDDNDNDSNVKDAEYEED